MMTPAEWITTAGLAALLPASGLQAALPYTIVGTGQTKCYGDSGEIAPPRPGEPFYGQDAQHRALIPAYKDNGDGTISDLNTGLSWVKARGAKVTWDAASAGAASCRVGGFSDWRMPTIKELYSLINFNGGFHFRAADSTPYLDTQYFDFKYGDEANGERGIDCQDWSATEYLGKTMGGNATVFGVNFADGRIKGYPKMRPGPQGMGRAAHTLYIRYVRGNPAYGKNEFQDNGDATITDRATGLMWQRSDSGKGLNWEQALAYATGLKLAGHADWRLPNAKELQSIVDYTTGWMQPRGGGPPGARGPGAEGPGMGGQRFGGAGQDRPAGFGQPPSGGSGTYQLMDVHGAGAQRSDPKTGDPRNYPHGRGPQGDVIRIYNFVRCVRDATP